MRELFIQVLKLSLSGSIVIGVVMLLRLILKKIPRKFICLLWLLAGLRLLVPFEIESNLSLQPRMEPVMESQWVQLGDYGHNLESGAPTDHGQTFPPEEAVGIQEAVSLEGSDATRMATHVPNWPYLVPYLWLAGVIAMGLYTLVSYLRLRRRITDSVIFSEGVWISGKLDSAFVLGFFRPQVYLNAGLTEMERELVLLHERCHIRRGDHLWKLLGFGVLAVHWFNPLVWIAYLLLCRDIEMACDEAVVRDMNVSRRKEYSAALLSCSVKGRTITACPVAFGEVSVKQRIHKVLHYRKPGFWMILIALIAVAAVAVCFLTTPAGDTIGKEQLTQKCVDALTELQGRNCVHMSVNLTVEDDPDEAGGYNEYWQCGDRWMRICESYFYDSTKNFTVGNLLSARGVQYRFGHAGGYGEEERRWTEATSHQEWEPVWLMSYDLSKADITSAEAVAEGDGMAVTVHYNGNAGKETSSTIYECVHVFHLDENGHLTCLEESSTRLIADGDSEYFVDIFAEYYILHTPDAEIDAAIKQALREVFPKAIE